MKSRLSIRLVALMMVFFVAMGMMVAVNVADVAAEPASDEIGSISIDIDTSEPQIPVVDTITTQSTKSKGSKVVSYAKKFVGNPYRYGGSSLTHGADCSGFVMSVYRHFGYKLPHSSSAIAKKGKRVSWSKKRPGDVICYYGHVAIYIGNNKIVHASNRKTGIKISKKANYRKVRCVRRILK